MSDFQIDISISETFIYYFESLRYGSSIKDINLSNDCLNHINTNYPNYHEMDVRHFSLVFHVLEFYGEDEMFELCKKYYEYIEFNHLDSDGNNILMKYLKNGGNNMEIIWK